MYQEVAHDLGVRSTTINGHTYTLQLMPAFPAMEMAKDVLNLLGPVLSAIFDKIRTSDTLLPEDDMTFTEISMVLVRQLKELQLSSLMVQLLDGLIVDGKKVDPNIYFRGKLKDMLSVLEFSIKENGILDFFIDFLREKGLEIPSLREIQDLVKKPEVEDTTLSEPSNS